MVMCFFFVVIYLKFCWSEFIRNEKVSVSPIWTMLLYLAKCRSFVQCCSCSIENSIFHSKYDSDLFRSKKVISQDCQFAHGRALARSLTFAPDNLWCHRHQQNTCFCNLIKHMHRTDLDITTDIGKLTCCTLLLFRWKKEAKEKNTYILCCWNEIHAQHTVSTAYTQYALYNTHIHT